MFPSSYENARNLAAGALNLKNLEEFAARPVIFVAYGMEGNNTKYWDRDMEILSSNMFHSKSRNRNNSN